MRKRVIFALILVVLLAGCTSFFGFGGEGGPGNTTESPSSETPSETVYSINETQLESILIDLSDLPQSYSPAGESEVNASAGEEANIEGKIERVFSLNQSQNDPETPFYIASGAALYESPTAADEGVKSILTSNLTTRQQYSAASGHQATVGVFETNSGLQATIIVTQNQNLVYYVVLVGPQEYIERGEQLMNQMYLNSPELD